MPNYTKLFNSIVTSTIWSEDDKTRILWITMLAIADQHGEVQASIPGLAKLAGISTQDTEAALTKFLSPDKYSRTPDNEGRRIAVIPGGWEILNHKKYRRMASAADAKESNAERQRRYRDRNATVTACNAQVTARNADVTPGRERNAFVTAPTDKAEAEAEAIREREPRARGAPCTEDEAFAYARNLHVTPPFTREAVAKWFSTRSAMHWVRGGVNPIPVTEQTWKDDLRSSHQWATRTNANGKHQKPLNRMDAEFEIISQDL